jgi:hypothetical protein
LKSGVNRACCYEPDLNRTYEEMATRSRRDLHDAIGNRIELVSLLGATDRRRRTVACLSIERRDGCTSFDEDDPNIGAKILSAREFHNLPIRNGQDLLGDADTVMCVGEAKVCDLVAPCLDHARPAK